MENHDASLNSAFHALADPTRRAVVNRLTRSPAAVKELAEPFAMGLPAFLKHLKVLEESGLIVTKKAGRTRTCQLNIVQLTQAEKWLSAQRAVWHARADRLADYVETHLSEENGHDR